MKNKIINLTKQLIMIESISSDIEKLHKIIDFVETYIKENTNKKYFIEKLEFNQKPSLIIKNFDWKKADIVLNWHLDVVPSSENWQFNPYEKTWKLYGRWSWDMKSGCAIIIELMIELINSEFKDKKIMLILNTDEEIWWFNWVGELVKLGYIWKVVLIPDWWSLNEIVYKEKWVYHIEFEIKWKWAHASRPWLWDNAIDKTFKFYNKLKQLLEDQKIFSIGNDKWWETVSMTMIKWWKADNIICPLVRATIDIRFTEKFNIEKMWVFLKEIISKYDGEIIKTWTWEVLFTPEDNENLIKYVEITKKNIWKVNMVVEHWASDWRYFSELWSIVILHRPTCNYIHTKWEYVIINDLDKIYYCYKDFILS